MANELVHGSVGTTMTQAEFEAIGLHVFNSQATGDLVYASSTTQLSRLAKGAANTVLVMGASIPAWSATLAGLTLTAPVINGTVTTTGLTLPAHTLGGTVTLNAQVFDAGSGWTEIDTTGEAGLLIKTTASANIGVYLDLYQDSSSPAVGDQLANIRIYGEDSGGTKTQYGAMRWTVVDPIDAQEDVAFSMWMRGPAQGGLDEALRLSSAGLLSVDVAGSGSAAQVDLFDDYDDALVLRQGIQQNNRELLADMGVLERKETGSGYMMKVQPMVRLLAGGIYQTRTLIDQTKEELVERIEGLESKLLLLEA